MDSSKARMSIEQFVKRGRLGPDKTERQIIRTLGSHFGGSIAPILLMTEPSLAEVEGVGTVTLRFIKDRLEAYRLEPRDFCERVEDRVKTLYGSVEESPIQVLYILAVNQGIATFSHYHASPAVDLLARINPQMTIAELIAMDRATLAKYIDLHGITIDSHRSTIIINEIVERLRNWNMHLAKHPAQVAAS